MKCMYCGNEEQQTLWDEDDVIFCSLCHHRTRKDNGRVDLVKCPYCKRMRERKSMYCRYCNDSTWKTSTPRKFKEVDKFLKEQGY